MSSYKDVSISDWDVSKVSILKNGDEFSIMYDGNHVLLMMEGRLCIPYVFSSDKITLISEPDKVGLWRLDVDLSPRTNKSPYYWRKLSIIVGDICAKLSEIYPSVYRSPINEIAHNYAISSFLVRASKKNPRMSRVGRISSEDGKYVYNYTFAKIRFIVDTTGVQMELVRAFSTRTMIISRPQP